MLTQTPDLVHDIFAIIGMVAVTGGVLWFLYWMDRRWRDQDEPPPPEPTFLPPAEPSVRVSVSFRRLTDAWRERIDRTMPEWDIDGEVVTTTITTVPAVLDVDPAPLAVTAAVHVWNDPAEVEIWPDDHLLPASIFEDTKRDLVPMAMI